MTSGINERETHTYTSKCFEQSFYQQRTTRILQTAQFTQIKVCLLLSSVTITAFFLSEDRLFKIPLVSVCLSLLSILLSTPSYILQYIRFIQYVRTVLYLNGLLSYRLRQYKYQTKDYRLTSLALIYFILYFGTNWFS